MTPMLQRPPHCALLQAPACLGRSSPTHADSGATAPAKRLGWRRLALAAVMLALAACSSVPNQPGLSYASQADGAAYAGQRPKLLVLLVVDGLPQRQVLDYREQLSPDGFARFLSRGSHYTQAHYGHAFTVTAAGHAAMLSGAYSHRSGIIGNNWRDPETGAELYCTSDPSASYIGHPTAALDGTSPKNLRAETLGDVFKKTDARAKVIAVSGKDRGAILPAGQLGTAYMYMGSSGEFASSTYYMAQHPAWVQAFHRAKPANNYFNRVWQPLLPDAAYSRSLPDSQPWYAAGGALPKTFGDASGQPSPKFYASLLPSPYVDELTLAFAAAAIDGEQLGQDEVPDILSVSLSGHDYVNHAYGAESRLSHDHFLQLDRQLEGFFKLLDAKVGAGQYVAVLTADHGFMPAPEHRQSMGLEGGRIDPRSLLQGLNQHLQRFGPGEWVRGLSGSGVLLNRSLVRSTQQDPQALAQAAVTWLRQTTGVAAAYSRAELLAPAPHADQAPLFAAMRKSWHPDISGEVQLALKPGWMFATSPTGTTHGSPHPYDTHVPLLLYGPSWVNAGTVNSRVEVADLAPSLAALFQVRSPAQSEGKPLPRP